MPNCSWLARPILLVSLLGPLYSQQSASWQDPSPHLVQFVTIDNNVRLEVLDWGGSIRPIVLFARGGNTAHGFYELSPKPTAKYQVYRLTRRRFRACRFFGSAEAAG